MKWYAMIAVTMAVLTGQASGQQNTPQTGDIVVREPVFQTSGPYKIQEMMEPSLARFDRDVLARPGIGGIILLEGINDIGWPRMKLPAPGPGDPARRYASAESPFASEFVDAQDIIAGYQQIIDRARQHGIRVFIATMLPYEGADYYTEEGEEIRSAVNQWIRTSRAIDGYIDFDKAVLDPSYPKRSRDGYHSGDNLRPSALGYRAMAGAVDLALLREIQAGK